MAKFLVQHVQKLTRKLVVGRGLKIQFRSDLLVQNDERRDLIKWMFLDLWSLWFDARVLHEKACRAVFYECFDNSSIA